MAQAKAEADALFQQLKEATIGTPLYNEVLAMEGKPAPKETPTDNNNSNNPSITRVEVMERMNQIRKKKAGYLAATSGNVNLSTKFQWLPSDFQVDKSGQASVLSYINNLEPSNFSHASL